MSKFLQTLGLQPRVSLSFSRSLEQFFLTVGHNDFGNKPPILKGQVGQHQNQIYPLDCMRTSRNLKGQPGKLKERQGAPTGYYYYILQLRRVGLRLYRSSFPELSLPEGAGGAEAAARRNSARLKIKCWVQSYFVQKPIKAHLFNIFVFHMFESIKNGEHITDTYITETDTTELENLNHNIFDIFIIET